jgi:hypothetical protein
MLLFYMLQQIVLKVAYVSKIFINATFQNPKLSIASDPFHLKNSHSRHIGICKSKSKAVPLHAMKAHGGRGGIAPTHS